MPTGIHSKICTAGTRKRTEANSSLQRRWARCQLIHEAWIRLKLTLNHKMSDLWPCVIVETPYSGDIKANTKYAQEAMQDCLKQGEAPFLSHLLYTQVPSIGFVSDDDEKNQLIGREAAMKAGWAWGAKADKTVVYTDRGISSGMKAGIAAAEKAKRPIEYRSLPKLSQLPVFSFALHPEEHQPSGSLQMPIRIGKETLDHVKKLEIQ